jgi:hypothetical protein
MVNQPGPRIREQENCMPVENAVSRKANRLDPYLVANSKCCPVNDFLNSCCRALISPDIVETSVSSPQEIVTNEYVGIRSWPICGFG